MGSSLSVCGCDQQPTSARSSSLQEAAVVSPYRKRIGKSNVRFWAEVFLLAVDGTTPGSTKWQIVTPGLLPVNAARVGEAPSVVTRVTAQCAQMDSVIDSTIHVPGVDLFRGSECFVYWCDSRQGLTWGLNFVSSEDASFFLDLTRGKNSSFPNRRNGSTQSLSEQNGKVATEIRHPERPAAVTFFGNSANGSPKSQTHQQRRQSGEKLSQNWKDQIVASDRADNFNAYSWVVDNAGASSPVESGEFIFNNNSCKNDIKDVWQKHSTGVGVYDKSVMHMSLDSQVLKRMIDPLPTSSAKLMSTSAERVPIVPSRIQARHRSASSFRQQQSPSNSNGRASPLAILTSGNLANGCSLPLATRASFKENARSVEKRCSIYANSVAPSKNEKSLLLSNRTGEPVLLAIKDLAADDSNSLNSSVDGSTSSQSNRNVDFQKSSPSNKIRKAGHVAMKKWLQPGENGISIVSVENWKRYWCCLKGFSVHFYTVSHPLQQQPPSENGTGGFGVEEMCLSSEPEISLDLLNCLAQAVPEYPRREHVFSLTTGSGHSYLLQVSSDQEADAWIQALHTAGATALARTQSREVAQRAVRKELEKLEQKIEAVCKLIKMSQLPATAGTVSGYQTNQWEEELELFNVQHFMIKCYSMALKNRESPSSKKMLTSATKATKAHLSRLGAFTGSSMHAYVLVKSSGGKSRAVSSPQQRHVRTERSAEPTARRDDHSRTAPSAALSEDEAYAQRSSPGNGKLFKSRASLVQIALPNRQVTVVSVGDMETVAAVLQKACEKAGLSSDRCFLLLRRITTPGESHAPSDSEVLQPKIATHQVAIRERLVYHVHLNRNDAQDRIFGLTIRAQKQTTNKSRLSVSVTSVDDNGLAKRAGLVFGDELLAINGQRVSFLVSNEIEKLLQESQTLCLVLNTKRIALPVWLESVDYVGSDDSLKLGCSFSERVNFGVKRNGLLVMPEDDEEESENWFSDSCNATRFKAKYRNNFRTSSLSTRGRQRLSLPVIPTHPALSPIHRDSFSAHSSPNHSDQRNIAASKIRKRISCSEPGSITMASSFAAPSGGGPPSRSGSIKIGATERLEKIVFELVETEKAYVKDLDALMEIYLTPMRNERTLAIPKDDLDRLVTSTFAIIKFQKAFLEELAEAVGADNGLLALTYSSPSHLRNALLHLGGVFLTSASGFKAYSSFCAAYFRFLKILQSDEQNESLQQFLLTRNVQRQHSATLESFLIKPVQRVLRYPLFLQQIKTLTNQNQPEHMQISDALAKMEKVAEYINEMQRIYEEYGSLFTQVQTQYRHLRDMSFELCDLLMFGEVDWLNANDEQNSKKKSAPIDCLCFVFKSAILLMSQEKNRQRKVKGGGAEKQTIYRFIPVNELEINGSDVGSSENRFIWILIHIDPVTRTERVYHFANKKPEAKQQFLKAIRKAGVLAAKQNGCRKGAGYKILSTPPVVPRSCHGFDRGKRPTSFQSNQSDPGYGSSTNGETHKRLL